MLVLNAAVRELQKIPVPASTPFRLRAMFSFCFLPCVIVASVCARAQRPIVRSENLICYR